ncbi:MAG: mannose-1-phosphate guanylyltransferase/mannose-6-phosphate isomerase [Coriobacteriia bacterium]|nr:mannose-1-phosphate guanylyltransferase/mannose-6-phosphate isomerase [Coriobacteriia bacterium]
MASAVSHQPASTSRSVPPIEHLYGCVLAGGKGQRFWPLSRELSPKQLLSVFGTDSLITQAVRRVLPYAGGAGAAGGTDAPGGTGGGGAGCTRDGSVLIVTGELLVDEIRNHLSAVAAAAKDPAFQRLRYLVEPLPRNTAPAVALAAAVLAADDPEALMIVLPSDHLLDAGEVWAEAVHTASMMARDGYLVTLGIRPTRPETGYGYIRGAQELAEYAGGRLRPLKAAAFVEKPSLDVAERYLASGEYFWNAGIFVMKATRVLEELRAAGSDGAAIAEAAQWTAAQWVAARSGDEAVADMARERFSAVPALSIDVAVMERSDAVAVIPADIAWNDVGSLLALEKVAEADDSGMVRAGRGIDIGSTDSVVYSADRLVATLGIENLIVADTQDATLVVHKEHAQDVFLVFEALKAAGAEEVTEPKVSMRPWGSWTVLYQGLGFKIKLIEIKEGARLSLQRHFRRSEHWIVVEGLAVVTLGDEQLDVAVNESTFIPVGETHRLGNGGSGLLKVIEVQVGGYLGEDDITRLDDDWDRQK